MPNDLDRKAAAHRWMGALPREQFDLLLLLLNEQAVAARLTAERDALERAAVIADEVSAGFLSPDYAAGQPLSSLTERMACSMCAAAIRAAKEQDNG